MNQTVVMRAARWLLFAILTGWQTDAAKLVYSTYFGATNYEGAFAVVTDAAGNAYVAGGTTSPSQFPTLNPLQPIYGGGFSDGFVTKFDPNGQLVFSTYFGGAGYDYINAIALDGAGNIVFGGETRSTDLPTTPDAWQPNYGGGTSAGYGDGFIVKLSTDGSQLLYCSYFGGSGDEKINGLAIDAFGNLCITGQTDSTDLPLRNPWQPKMAGGNDDGYVAKFDASLTNLVFSTYFGGENHEQDQKIAVDAAGFIYVSGATFSTNFPTTPGAFQTNLWVVPELGENSDGFVTKFKPDGSGLVYSTFIGSALNDAVYALAVDSRGSVCVTGEIRAEFEGVHYGFQSQPGLPGGDAFLAKFTPDGSDFEWFSYIAGTGNDYGYGLALDSEGNVFVTGITDSRDFPIIDPPQPHFGGGDQDAFVAKVSADGQKLIYSTYLGGGNTEWGYAVAVAPDGNLIAVGQTAALNFPVQAPWQNTLSGGVDAYIVKISPVVQAPMLQIAPSGSSVLLTWSTNFVGYAVQDADPSVLPMAWNTISAQPFLIGSQNAVIQKSTNGARLYRLRRP